MNRRNVKRSKLIVASICLLVFAFLSCNQHTNKNESTESTLTIHFEGDERALGPLGYWPWFLVFLPLSTEDESGNPLPRLMERWEHTPNYKDWMIYLRKDVNWEDGVPVTAADVKFSIELWTHPEVGYEYGEFEAINIIDDYTLQIKFEKPFRFSVLYYSWLVMLPKHLLENLAPNDIYNWEFWKQPVGNGPYRYVRHVPKTMIELEVNPTYYQDKPKIDKVVLRFGGNPITELKSGNVDIVIKITPQESVILGKDPLFRVYYATNFFTNVMIVWNHLNPLFSDSNVRKALTMAINRRELQHVLNYPDGIPIYDVYFLKRHFLQDQVPEALPYDPEQAKLLLEKAGWIDVNNNSVREKDNKEFRFTVTTSSETEAEAIYIQDQFRRIGIRMEISTVEEELLRNKMFDGKNLEAALGNIDWYLFHRMLSAAGYKNSEFYRLYDDAHQTTDLDKANKYLRELWPIFQADMPVTYLHPDIEYRAAHKRVKGLGNQSLSDPFGGIERLWIEDEKDNAE